MSESNVRDELIEYIASGQTQKARDLLSDIPDGGVDDEGNTLYHEAVTLQDTKLLKWLLANYQDRVPVTRTNKEGSTCFHLACAGGKTQTFLVLWENDSVSQKTLCQIADQEGRTPLHIACLNGCSDVVRDIVYKFREEVVNDLTANGQSALHISAARGDNSSIRYLTPYKKLIDLTDSYGATPLHYAANGGHMVTAQYLIEKSKADRTKVTQNEMNVVHAAVASGDARTIRYILTKTKYHQHLAKTSTGATVLHIATGMGYDGILSLLLQLKHIYPLIDHQEEKGWTASHLAALRNRAGCLAVLIGRAADVYNITDKNGMSAYQIMCNNESKEMRQTFPYLYEQINSLRSRSKAERRTDRRSHTTYSGTTQSGSESYEELYPPGGGPAYVPLHGYAQPHYRSYPLPDEYFARTQGLRYYDFGFPPRQAGFPPRNSSFQARPVGFPPRPVSYPPRHEEFQNGYVEFRQEGSREGSRLRREDFQLDGESPSSPSSQERYGSSQSNSREKVKLTESYIMKNKMDFTKTNPIADDDVLETPPQVKQRKFKRNTMALPQNNANQMPVMSFQTGKENDSDGEFNIDDIEQIPETPLRKIQEFNNFRHSTYTPTQSTEDLTKVADDTRTSSSNSPPSKTARLEDTRQLTVEINYEENNNTDITVKTDDQTVTYSPMNVSVSPQTMVAHGGRVSYHFSDSEDTSYSDDTSTGEPLPIILDYQSRLVNDDDAVTIFFHNGELNTVKVKTVTERKIKKQKRKIVRKATGIHHQNTNTRSVELDQGLLIAAEPMQVSQATSSATPILVTKVRENNSITMRKSSIETISLSSVGSSPDAVEVNVISQYRSDTIMKASVSSYIGPDPDDLPLPPPPPPQHSNSMQVHEINNSDSLEIVRHYRGADSVEDISSGQEFTSGSHMEIVHHYQGADLVDDNHGGQESINKLEIVHHYQGADLVGETHCGQESVNKLEIVHHYQGADLVDDNLGGQESINKLEIVHHYQGADLVDDNHGGQESNSNLETVHHYQGADLVEDIHNGSNLEIVRSYRGADLEESFPPPPPPPVVSEFTEVATSSVHAANIGGQLEMMDEEQRSTSPSPNISSRMSGSPQSKRYHRSSSPPSPVRGRSSSSSEERYQIDSTVVRTSTAGLESEEGRNIQFSEIVDSETGELQNMQNPAREVTIIENIPPAPGLLPRLDFPTSTESVRPSTSALSPPPPITPDYPTISSPSELSKGQFSFQVITTDDSSQVTEAAQTSRRVEFGSTELIPTSPDTVEKEYLSFAQNELRQSRELGQSAESEGYKRQEVTPEPQGRRPSILNIVQRFNSQDSSEAGEERRARPGSILDRVRRYEQEAKQNRTADENQEPVYAVINKNRQDVRQPLRRVPSNVSDVSETSELKSSTAYKFNYRAYRKKISTKHDTVTDLFEYDPVS